MLPACCLQRNPRKDWTPEDRRLQIRELSEKSDRSRINFLFAERLRRAQQIAPGLRVRLVFGDPKDFPNTRNFAMCGPEDKGFIVIVAPKIVKEPKAVYDALIRHELAHAVLLHCGAIGHSERDADVAAETIFRGKIYYDARDVETLARTQKRIRPAYLPR